MNQTPVSDDLFNRAAEQLKTATAAELWELAAECPDLAARLLTAVRNADNAEGVNALRVGFLTGDIQAAWNELHDAMAVIRADEMTVSEDRDDY